MIENCVKTTAGLFVFLLSANQLMAQSRLVMSNDAFLVLGSTSNTNPAFLIIDNEDANALSTATGGGNIITQRENTVVQWNIGTNTGNYTVPFSTAETATNSTTENIPLSVNITAAGSGSGNIQFSSYTDNNSTDNYKISDYKPSDVGNVDRNGSDNSAHVVNRWWIIDADGYTTKPAVTLGFTYDEDEVSSTGNSIVESVIFTQRWNSTLDMWNDVTLSGTLNTNNNTYSGVAVSSGNFFRSWVLSSTSSPLPVEMLYFNAECYENKVMLNWATSLEINNDRFLIQHASDGINWQNIDSVYGMGNTTNTTHYQYLVQNPDANKPYYRLKQIDFDGTYSYTNMQTTNCHSNFAISVFPNPTSGTAHIAFETESETEATIQLYTALGKLVNTQTLNLSAGAYTHPYHINVSSGNYYVRVTINNEQVHQQELVVISNK